ncbi:acetate--CoA ligase family protein [Streptomyces sp. NPDC059477]|uniref:acetate--CoA ligase family protein n=1 Tax=Streptomyces sp. NPDC059477 TaxID=3346847 RepID=UPI0036BD4FE8
MSTARSDTDAPPDTNPDTWREGRVSPAADAAGGGSRSAIARIVTPESIAVIGVSTRARSVSHTLVDNLLSNGYEGRLHLVGRQAGEVAGRPVLPGTDALPEPVDLAVVAVPAAAVPQSIAGLAGRAAGAVCFASGFAEAGPSGQVAQQQLAEVVRASRLRLLGPNCLGFFNYVDGVHIKMTPMAKQQPMPRDRGPAVAVAAQSGSLAAHVVGSLTRRGVPIAYSVSTGNEADLDLADFVELFRQEPLIGTIAVYAEQIRRPDRFLAAVAAARAAGKPVVVLHPGRSAAARAAAQSHTGALSGDHALISTVLTGVGGVVAHTLEELIDLTELLRHEPELSDAGLVSVNGSGAVGVLLQDYADDVGLPLAELSAPTRAALAERSPDYLTPRNPVDLGTGLALDDTIVPAAIRAVVDDPATGSLLLTLPYLNQPSMRSALEGFIAETTRARRIPAVFSVAEEDRDLWPEVAELAQRSGAVTSRSPERSVRALARLREVAVAARHGRREVGPRAEPLGLPAGPQAEWRAKELLRAIGVPVPDGSLVSSADEAVAVARSLGYPVAVKAQSAAMTHKSDLGAVALGLGDADAVRRAYERVCGAVADRLPTLSLDGVLVEQMAEPGVELVIGGRRDPAWGPVLLVGLGGVWIETLHDVRLLPPDLSAPDIADELLRLKGAALLTGARGTAPVDVRAVADVAVAVGEFMITHPEVSEIDLNPVIAGPRGARVADALLVLAAPDAPAHSSGPSPDGSGAGAETDAARPAPDLPLSETTT